MKRCLTLLLAALLLAAVGCSGSDKDRGVNSNKGKPRTTSNE
jgi:hypothetical protein